MPGTEGTKVSHLDNFSTPMEEYLDNTDKKERHEPCHILISDCSRFLPSLGPGCHCHLCPTVVGDRGDLGCCRYSLHAALWSKQWDQGAL